MRAMAQRRCAPLTARDRVRLAAGTAARTDRPDTCVDVVIAVNKLQLWPGLPAALAGFHRVLRPGGRLLLSTHERWLPTDLTTLATTVEAAGFTSVRTWTGCPRAQHTDGGPAERGTRPGVRRGGPTPDRNRSAS